MILSSEVNENDVDQMLAFYREHFDVVDLVSCSVCGAFLAFECMGADGMGIAPNEIGKYIIPIGENLLSSRVRLDEAPNGERMMGYQCGAPVPNPAYPIAVKQHEADVAAYDKQFKKDVAAQKKNGGPELGYGPPAMPPVPEMIPCGNDTRIAEIERGQVPVGPTAVTLSPFEKHRIRLNIRDQKHKPDFKQVGNIKHFESFQVERIK